MHRFRLAPVTLLLCCFATTGTRGDEELAVRAIVQTYLDGAIKNDPAVYAQTCLDKGKVAFGRTKDANENDAELELEQWKELMLAYFPGSKESESPTCSDISVTIKGNEATLGLRGSFMDKTSFGASFDLRKTETGWRIQKQRIGLIAFGGRSIAEMDKDVDALLKDQAKELEAFTKDMIINPVKVADVLLATGIAGRFREAHSLLKKWMTQYGEIPEPKNAKDLQSSSFYSKVFEARAILAALAGEPTDAHTSFEKALAYERVPGTKKVPQAVSDAFKPKER